jgi:hypothetical protein
MQLLMQAWPSLKNNQEKCVSRNDLSGATHSGPLPVSCRSFVLSLDKLLAKKEKEKQTNKKEKEVICQKGLREYNRVVNLFKVYCMQLWNYHNKTTLCY